MKRFTNFITEQVESEEGGKPLKHLAHLEDHIIHSGNKGVKIAGHALENAHAALMGKKSDLHITTKYDGAPSVVFGYHPKTGRFFASLPPRPTRIRPLKWRADHQSAAL